MAVADAPSEGMWDKLTGFIGGLFRTEVGRKTRTEAATITQNGKTRKVSRTMTLITYSDGTTETITEDVDIVENLGTGNVGQRGSVVTTTSSKTAVESRPSFLRSGTTKTTTSKTSIHRS